MAETNKINQHEDDPIDKSSVNCKLKTSSMKKFRAIGGLRGHKTLADTVYEAMLEYIDKHIDELKK